SGSCSQACLRDAPNRPALVVPGAVGIGRETDDERRMTRDEEVAMDTRGNTGTMVDGVELLTSQHRDVEQLWSHLRASHASGDKVQADQAKRIITMLSQHDAIETQVLYPAVREVTEGDQL